MTSFFVPSPLVTQNNYVSFNSSMPPSNPQSPLHELTKSHQISSHNFVGLQIYFENISGMRSKLTDFKLAVLENDFDVITIVETWLYPDLLVSEFFDETNYNVYRLDRCTRKSQRGGGILIAIKSSYTSSLLPLVNQDDMEQLCVCISPSSVFSYKLYIFLSYIPPSSPLEVYTKHLLNILSPLNNTHDDVNTHFITLGDFNLPNIDWRFDIEEKVLTPFNISSIIERTFIDSLLDNNFTQINDICNCHGKFLDLVFISEDFIYSVLPVDNPLASTDSHHKPISIYIERYGFAPMSYSPSPQPSEPNFANSDFNALDSLFSSVNWTTLFANLSIEDMFQKFMCILNTGFMNFVPNKVHRNINEPPWFNKSLKRLKNARNKAHKLFSKIGGTHHYNIFSQLRREYQMLHRFLYRNYIWSVERDLKANSKRFWVYINKIRNSSGFPNQMTYQGNTSTNLQTSVDLFADYFCSVYNSDEHQASSNFNHLHPITSVGLIHISEDEVIRAMQLLDSNAKPDSDNICNLLLRKCCSSLGPPLTLIFQDSLKSGHFLDRWKFSSITPIYKSGSKQDITNYRGIAKLLVIPKLFESIVKTKIYEKVKNSISPSQHGFVSGRSSTTNLVLYINKLTNWLENGAQVDAVYTDFSKAFDRVIINLLIAKLAALGFHSSILQWIGSYFSNRFQVVKIGKVTSKMFKAFSGVPQGSHLGPLLFILMINDLPLLFNPDYILIYADDVKLFAEIKSDNDIKKLQSDINSLAFWCSQNGFSLNYSKCSVMSFYRCRNPCIAGYSLDNYPLRRVDSVKDLGIILDTKLSFIPHYDYTCSKACRMLGFLKRNTREFKDFLTLKSLFCSLVRSVLEYGSIIWNPGYQVHCDRFERVQKSFSRLALVRYGFDYRELPAYPVRCKLLGLESLSNRRQIASIAFIHDILTSRIDCPNLLNLLCINTPVINLRNRTFLSVPFHPTNYGRNEPITNSIVLYNKAFHLIDFHLSRDSCLKAVKMFFYNNVN